MWKTTLGQREWSVSWRGCKPNLVYPVVHLCQTVQEVASTDVPVTIQNWSEDRAVIISVCDFQWLWPVEEITDGSARERVRTALQTAG